jgi:hypothetical protein
LLFVALFEKTKKKIVVEVFVFLQASTNIFLSPLLLYSGPLEPEYNQIKSIRLDLFNGTNYDDLLWHVYKFVKRCEELSVCDVSNDIIKMLVMISLKPNYFLILC